MCNPRRERHERADDRDDPAEEAGRIAVSREEVVGLVEVRGADAEVATPALEDRAPTPRTDAVRDERAHRRPKRPGQNGEPVIPRLTGEGLQGPALADEESSEREDGWRCG